MKVLHVTPHLGGGVGKAHAAMRDVLPAEIDQTFVLLEAPRDRRYVQLVENSGAQVIVADNLKQVARLAGEVDIVQFEFWNHPRLFECLANCAFPAIRSLFWSHISGVGRPLIPPGLMEEAMRFVFTTRASLDIASLAHLSEAALSRTAVINSGFGFAGGERQAARRERKPTIAYLGTVDFVKMHPGFFDAIDGLCGDDIRVSVWGAVDPSGPVAARARAMRHPERVEFRGETAEPASALAEADIFFYPLRPDHYGTAENALIEAMSLGLVPVVMNNAAEMAIVRDRETGFVARSIEESVALLQMLLSSPQTRERVSQKAMDHIAETRTPDRSVSDFMIVWLGMLGKQPRHCDFRAAIGDNPADWFVATQCLPGATWQSPTAKDAQQPAKGTLAHFESVFAGDGSLARLRR
ncbi:MAG: glycosyltransferase family 4 protein [Rhizobiales bacterium]|nr:glycosyltransferase family 4 protein [Hyphomicrobiales bacterium]